MTATPVITIDVDWVPDFMIDEVAGTLESAGVKATWFVTHASEAIDRLKALNRLFEIGTHPNFLPGSSHGASSGDVIAHMAALLPEARVMRSHGLCQSSRMFHEIAESTEIELDCSLFISGAPRSSVWEYWTPRRRLTRVSYVWEDSYAFYDPGAAWRLADLLPGWDGPAVLDFHPIHILLNDPTPDAYHRLRQRCPDIKAIRPEDLEDLRHDGDGPRALFEDAVAHLVGRSGGMTVSELAAQAGCPG
jgi:hypothetical protein